MFGKIIEKIMIKMISGQDKEKMMEDVMGKFFNDMSTEEKNNIIKKVMSHMMEDLDIMSMIPQVAQYMMPQCLGMILPKLDNEAKELFMSKMLEILLKQGYQDLPEENKNILKDKINNLLSDKGPVSNLSSKAITPSK